MIHELFDLSARAHSDTALGRPGRPAEVGTTALYLASPMSSFTTAPWSASTVVSTSFGP